jgi:hypothetical protein
MCEWELQLYLADFPEVGWWYLHPFCLYPSSNFRMSEPVFMKLGVYILATEPSQPHTS